MNKKETTYGKDSAELRNPYYVYRQRWRSL